jgi:two-component system CheB/CheR fusion protein
VPANDSSPGTSEISVERVLLVEDNDDACAAMAMLLQLEGFAVETASNGASAIASATCALPDLVLLDIGLPDMDGFEVARRIRALPDGHHCIMIAVTGYGQPQDVVKALAAGFDHHITKPLSLSALHEAIAAVRRTRQDMMRAARWHLSQSDNR